MATPGVAAPGEIGHAHVVVDRRAGEGSWNNEDKLLTTRSLAQHPPLTRLHMDLITPQQKEFKLKGHG